MMRRHPGSEAKGIIMAIDYDRLASIDDPRRRYVATQEAVARAGKIILSDALINRDHGGNYVLVYLDKEQLDGVRDENGIVRPAEIRTFKIKILFDEFGNPPKPGTEHKWLFGRTKRDKFGWKISTRQAKEIIRKGNRVELETYHAAKIDNNGCITVPYKDAVHLLDNWGIHYFSNEPISRMREFTRWTKKNPESGEMEHVHNWRYVEVPHGMENKNDAFGDQEKTGAGIGETQGGGKGRR
jgi:hypothetical protein